MSIKWGVSDSSPSGTIYLFLLITNSCIGPVLLVLEMRPLDVMGVVSGHVRRPLSHRPPYIMAFSIPFLFTKGNPMELIISDPKKSGF